MYVCMYPAGDLMLNKKLTGALVWSRLLGEERNEWGKKMGLAIYAVKMLYVCMYPAGGLMLKKKLLPLMIRLLAILNHLEGIHL